MNEDPGEAIFLASQLGGDAAAAELRRLALRYANQYRKGRDADKAYFVGRAYYEMPDGVSKRALKARLWLNRSIVGRREDAFALFLMGALSFDEHDYSAANCKLAEIPAGAFSQMSADWVWRDIKVLEMRCACAIHQGDQLAAQRISKEYAESVAAVEEVEVPAPHELLNALRTCPDFAALAGISRALHLHLRIDWGGSLGRGLRELARV